MRLTLRADTATPARYRCRQVNYSVDIVSVPVTDQTRAKAFYSDVLGFGVREEAELGEGRRWVELVPPAGGASISLVTWYEAMPAGSVHGLVLGTDDAHAAFAELQSRGVIFGEAGVQAASWGQYATFADPDGNCWVLVGPVADEGDSDVA
jgi:catechol 2,3-dioxygenase-like lactoylglutathione lyase family enzyme